MDLLLIEKIFAGTSKNLVKSRNWTPPAVYYPTSQNSVNDCRPRPIPEIAWPDKVRSSLDFCHWFIIKFYLIYFQFVQFLHFQVATSFSSKWWRHENWWRYEKATWYLFSVFPLISIPWCATTILKSDFKFVESLRQYEIILEVLQFWCVKRAIQTKN